LVDHVLIGPNQTWSNLDRDAEEPQP